MPAFYTLDFTQRKQVYSNFGALTAQRKINVMYTMNIPEFVTDAVTNVKDIH